MITGLLILLAFVLGWALRGRAERERRRGRRGGYVP